jgi:hypothetical protein
MGDKFHFQRYLSYILAATALLAEESGLHGKNKRYTVEPIGCRNTQVLCLLTEIL